VTPVVFLAPHLDDAVLSCGGLIGRLARRGRRVVVVTAFAGANPAPEFPPAARRLHRAAGYRDEEAVAVRRREDGLACARLAASAVHLDVPEALYRRDARGRPIYPRLGSAFASRPEPDLLDELTRRLRRELAGLGPSRLFAPLGLGGHADHVLLRGAVDRVWPDAVLWEDLPYAASGAPEAAGLRPVTVHVAPVDWEARLAAARLYASQVPLLWGGAGKMERALTEFALGVGGGRPAERFWRRCRGCRPR
jgi:LmbE family N-acetylglucosaminyl deacetylase